MATMLINPNEKENKQKIIDNLIKYYNNKFFKKTIENHINTSHPITLINERYNTKISKEFYNKFLFKEYKFKLLNFLDRNYNHQLKTIENSIEIDDINKQLIDNYINPINNDNNSSYYNILNYHVLNNFNENQLILFYLNKNYEDIKNNTLVISKKITDVDEYYNAYMTTITNNYEHLNNIIEELHKNIKITKETYHVINNKYDNFKKDSNNFKEDTMNIITNLKNDYNNFKEDTMNIIHKIQMEQKILQENYTNINIKQNICITAILIMIPIILLIRLC